MKNRKEKIIRLLKEKKYLTIKELAQHYDVSLNTIRSDLSFLQEDGSIVKFHGGVLLAENNNTTIDNLKTRHSSFLEEKKYIAQLVASNLPKKDLSIMFDSSTTSMEVAKILVSFNYRITVITNFTNIAQILSKNSNHSIVLCGGKWLDYENCTIGDEVINMLESYAVDYAILGCTAIDIDGGVYNGSYETVPIKQKMLECARETWVVCDSNKFNKKDLKSMFAVSDVSAIITNKYISSDWDIHCKKNNIKFIYK